MFAADTLVSIYIIYVVYDFTLGSNYTFFNPLSLFNLATLLDEVAGKFTNNETVNIHVSIT